VAAAHRKLLPDDDLDQLRPEERAQGDDFTTFDLVKPKTVVAADEGLIYGFAATAPSRERGSPRPRILGPGYWCCSCVGGTLQSFCTRISKRVSVGPGGQCSCRALLSNRSVDARWSPSNRNNVGHNGQRSPLPPRTVSPDGPLNANTGPTYPKKRNRVAAFVGAWRVLFPAAFQATMLDLPGIRPR
jgi:hypothetical protein